MPIDLLSPEALATAKLSFDTLRSLIGVVRDTKSLLPSGPKSEAIEVVLKESERQLQIAEGQLAQAFGYELCKCQFPLTPMLLVGHERSGAKAFECPKCGSNTAAPRGFTRTRSISGEPVAK